MSDDWLGEYLDEADLARLGEIVVPVTPDRDLDLISLVLAWRAHLAKLEADLLAPLDDRAIWGAHDYIAALYFRDWIAQGTATLAPDLRYRIGLAVTEIDNRFRAFTEPDVDACTERAEGEPDPTRDWWWYRIPRLGPVHDEMTLHYGHALHE